MLAIQIRVNSIAMYRYSNPKQEMDILSQEIRNLFVM